MTQDGKRMDETTNAKCNVTIAPHSGTVKLSDLLLLLKNVVEKGQRKSKKEENAGIRNNGAECCLPRYFPFYPDAVVERIQGLIQGTRSGL